LYFPVSVTGSCLNVGVQVIRSIISRRLGWENPTTLIGILELMLGFTSFYPT